jgi:Helix-turn-helix domain
MARTKINTQAIDCQPLAGRVRYEFERAMLGRPEVSSPLLLATSTAILEFSRGSADCWPNNEAIAKKAKCSTRQIQRALKELETGGVIRCYHDRSLSYEKSPKRKPRGGRRIVLLEHPNTPRVLAELDKHKHGPKPVTRSPEGGRVNTWRGDRLVGEGVTETIGEGVTETTPPLEPPIAAETQHLTVPVREAQQLETPHANPPEISISINGNGRDAPAEAVTRAPTVPKHRVDMATAPVDDPIIRSFLAPKPHIDPAPTKDEILDHVLTRGQTATQGPPDLAKTIQSETEARDAVHRRQALLRQAEAALRELERDTLPSTVSRAAIALTVAMKQFDPPGKDFTKAYRQAVLHVQEGVLPADVLLREFLGATDGTADSPSKAFASRVSKALNDAGYDRANRAELGVRRRRQHWTPRAV